MAQTGDGISLVNGTVEMSTNFSTWTDISGFSNSLVPEGAERATGELATADGDTPVLTTGKLSATSITLKAVYTEGAAEVWKTAYDALQNGTPFYLRWTPNAATTGNYRFTTDPNYSYVVKCPPPGGDFGSPDPVAVEITVATKGITYAAIT